MNLQSKAIAQLSISIVLLSGCAPAEEDKIPFPQHVTSVIRDFQNGGFPCANARVSLGTGSSSESHVWNFSSDFEPDYLICNESDSNTLGDEFRVFASKEEAASYYKEGCSGRPGGFATYEWMISPTVSLRWFHENPVDKANYFAQLLGHSKAQEVRSMCDYLNLNW
jgi:hypothetical protein